MEEQEKRFRCPYCLEKISLLIDLSTEGEQTYIEDCEVCCHPLQVTYCVSNKGKLQQFQIAKP